MRVINNILEMLKRNKIEPIFSSTFFPVIIIGLVYFKDLVHNINILICLFSFGSIMMNILVYAGLKENDWFKSYDELEELKKKLLKKEKIQNIALLKLNEVIFDLSIKEELLRSEAESPLDGNDLEDVIQIVLNNIEEYTGISRHQIKSKSRKQEIVEARIMFTNILMRELNTTLTLEDMGSIINRDHSTILYHQKQHDITLKQSKAYASKYNTILKNILARIDVYFQE